MAGAEAERIELVVERIAAALFAAAVAYAFFGLMGGAYHRPQLSIYSAAAAIAFLLCTRALGSVATEDRRFAMPAFDVPPMAVPLMAASPVDEPLPNRFDEFRIVACGDADELLLTEAVELLLTEQVELVLTDADRLGPPRVRPDAALALDEILAELGPDSRVVRLFDPAAMPTPRELNSRIARHLGDGSPPAPTDDSQALYDALAELRRSLR